MPSAQLLPDRLLIAFPLNNPASPVHKMPHSDRLILANQIAKLAGQLTLNYFQTDQFSVDYKGDGSPLTIADREAETHLRAEIEAAFPDDAIQGEEFDDKDGTSGFRWILDPIDGTKSFISGVPLYGTMVAVEKIEDNLNRQAVIGSVYFPGLDEGIYAAKGSGAFSFKGTGKPQIARVSQKKDIKKSVLLTTSVPDFAARGAGEAYAKLANEFYFSRTWGDVYGYYLVAIGRAEAMVDPELNVWDAAAVQPIIEEAGGRYSDWNGQAKIDTGDAVGSNGQFHDRILELLNS